MEIELKFASTEEQGNELLEDLKREYGMDIRDIPMKAVYYDTRGRALRENRLTYRIRQEGDEHYLTIKYGKGSDKGKNGLHKREEINIRVSEDFIEKPGIDVLDDTPVYKEFDRAVGGQYSDDLGVMLPLDPLVPVIRMDFLRRELTVPIGPEGRSSAVVSYDLGNISAGSKTELISEVEAELFEGFEEDLTEFGQKISQKYGLEPLNKSKYARGLKLLGE